MSWCVQALIKRRQIKWPACVQNSDLWRWSFILLLIGCSLFLYNVPHLVMMLISFLGKGTWRQELLAPKTSHIYKSQDSFLRQIQRGNFSILPCRHTTCLLTFLMLSSNHILLMGGETRIFIPVKVTSNNKHWVSLIPASQNASDQHLILCQYCYVLLFKGLTYLYFMS